VPLVETQKICARGYCLRSSHCHVIIPLVVITPADSPAEVPQLEFEERGLRFSLSLHSVGQTVNMRCGVVSLCSHTHNKFEIGSYTHNKHSRNRETRTTYINRGNFLVLFVKLECRIFPPV